MAEGEGEGRGVYVGEGEVKLCMRGGEGEVCMWGRVRVAHVGRGG